MAITVRLTGPLRSLTQGAPEVQLDAVSVGDALAVLDEAHPGFRERLFDETGELYRFVNVFVDGDDVRVGAGLATLLAEGQVVSVVPAVAGG